MDNHTNNDVIVSHLIVKMVTQRQLRRTFRNGNLNPKRTNAPFEKHTIVLLFLININNI